MKKKVKHLGIILVICILFVNSVHTFAVPKNKGTTPSAPSLSYYPTAPTNGNVTVTVTYPSNAIIKQYKLGIDSSWITYSAPVVLTSNTNVTARYQNSTGIWSSSAVVNVSNIDKTPPAYPTFTASSTIPTNQDVTVSIGFSLDSTFKQYKIGSSGVWDSYTTPIVLSENNTIYAKASDAVGNWTPEVSYTINNISSTEITKMVLGYTVKYWSTDMSSYNSLTANGSSLDEIATATYSVDGYGTLTGTAPLDQINYANSNGIRTKLMVSNNFDSNIAKLLLDSPENRQNLKNNILNLLQTYNYKGVDIDIESIPAACRENFTSLLREIYTTLNPLGYGVSVAVQAKTYDSPNATWNYAFDYKSLAMYSDYLMIMAYDEHYPGGTPGPVASIGWVTNVVDYALTVVPKEKIVLGLAAYGYDWSSSATKSYSINNCYNLANQYGATVYLDSVTKSKYFTYTVSGVSHTVWFEDGDTISYKLDLVNSKDLKGIGIWRLGLENASFWNTIKMKLNK